MSLNQWCDTKETEYFQRPLESVEQAYTRFTMTRRYVKWLKDASADTFSVQQFSDFTAFVNENILLVSQHTISLSQLDSAISRNRDAISHLYLTGSSTPQFHDTLITPLCHLPISFSVVDFLASLLSTDAQHLRDLYSAFVSASVGRLSRDGYMDPDLQARNIQLICMLVKSLLKQEQQNSKESYLEETVKIELEAFCVKFMRECSALYQLLKTATTSIKSVRIYCNNSDTESSAISFGVFPSESLMRSLAPRDSRSLITCVSPHNAA